MADPIEGWWFAAGNTLPHGDGRKIVIGETHTLKGKIVLCEHALHFCRTPWGALQFAPGSYLYKVRASGTIVEDHEKAGCSRRTYLAMHDATDTLRAFARSEALRVIDLWDAPAIVREYLETGRKEIRDAAWDAAQNAAWDAARYTAKDAARHAARYTAQAAAAAQDAAQAAAWGAAQAAAWGAAQDAARYTAWDAAGERFNQSVAELFAEE